MGYHLPAVIAAAHIVSCSDDAVHAALHPAVIYLQVQVKFHAI